MIYGVPPVELSIDIRVFRISVELSPNAELALEELSIDIRGTSGRAFD